MAQNQAVMALKSKMVNKQPETRAEKVNNIETLIEKNMDKIGQVLPQSMTAERLARIALTSIRLNPKLADCTPQSFMGALFQAAFLGLEPNIEGQAYIIPYTNWKRVNGKSVAVTEAQFQIGYKGLIELFYRHKSAETIDVHTVYANDVFEYAYGTNPFLNHCPKLKDRGEVIGFYAVASINGKSLFKFMSYDECIEHGQKHSKTFITKEYDETTRRYVECVPHFKENTPWATDTNAMCKKTVLVQLAKLLPKSVELQKALAMDNTTKSKVDANMLAIPDETNWESENVEQLPNAVG